MQRKIPTQAAAARAIYGTTLRWHAKFPECREGQNHGQGNFLLPSAPPGAMYWVLLTGYPLSLFRISLRLSISTSPLESSRPDSYQHLLVWLTTRWRIWTHSSICWIDAWISTLRDVAPPSKRLSTHSYIVLNRLEEMMVRYEVCGSYGLQRLPYGCK